MHRSVLSRRTKAHINPMKKFSLYLLMLCGICYAGLCVALYFNQDNMLYFPQGRAVTDDNNTYLIPTEVGTTVVTTEARTSKNAIIYFGGNGEDVSLNLESFKQVFPDYSLYLMHYRGYGGSDGEPSEESFYKDGKALYESVSVDHENIVLIGRSLGSGIATRLAAENSPSKLILVTPYSSIEDIASEKFWVFPVSLILKDKYESWTYAKSIKADTSILWATNDELIPKSSTMKLFESFEEGVANIYAFENAGHNSISASQEYYELLYDLTRF